jgi:glycosyltransferase involved in cell wall biosynthesis
MINPQGRKNPELMAKIIQYGRPETSYRLLKGGWGNSFDSFKPKLASLLAGRKASVDYVEYVDDVRKAYLSSELFVLPSFEEGYGMSAVEAMYCGVPVVCSNYPAIIEAVGEGALTLCPFRNGHGDWVSAVAAVLSNKNYWRNRANERIEFLRRRQLLEIDTMSGFLASIF